MSFTLTSYLAKCLRNGWVGGPVIYWSFTRFHTFKTLVFSELSIWLLVLKINGRLERWCAGFSYFTALLLFFHSITCFPFRNSSGQRWGGFWRSQQKHIPHSNFDLESVYNVCPLMDSQIQLYRDSTSPTISSFQHHNKNPWACHNICFFLFCQS